MHIAQALATHRLDPASTTPMFRQLYDVIRQTILSGKIGPGTQLPPTRELAHSFGISRQTVLNAYAQLTAEGYLSGTVGKGTFVSTSLPITPKPGTPTPPKAIQLLHPLSARGEQFIGPQVAMSIHAGAPRAFRIGMPGLDVFPFDIWSRLDARHWRRSAGEFGYGDPAGFFSLRTALARYLRASRGVQCEPEQIIITSGSQQALFLIATMLLAPDEQAWMEEPGYRGISATLRAAGARICPVPVDEEGLCVAEGIKACPDARLVYVTPSHQQPLGVTMSLARRLELLAWADRNKIWVIEDDYDSEYRYTGPPLASLQSLDRAGCVIYVGTLSKVLFPGLRLGYLVAPPPLAEAFAQGKAIIDRHAPIVPQMVLADFIDEGHFSRHIKRTREAYAERRAALLDALEQNLQDEFILGRADAGLHLSVTFRRQLKDSEVSRAALDKGIEVRPLSQFYVGRDATGGADDKSRTNGLLLGFAAIPPEDIRRGVKTLRDVLGGM
ncbi:MAG TPA: PLP-dependent aminotransferase family protein [Noviherbaspirillum sp.]|nr:PLP-dependent aminotransferase family protein [Noviherbaspirillum sp.]